MTGEAVAAIFLVGQKYSLNPEGKALLNVEVSRCKRPARPFMLIPVSLTCLLINPITMGATMVSRVVVAPGVKPTERLMLLVTMFPPSPNSDESRPLPALIKDELGSDAALAACDHEVVPSVLGTASSICRKTPELSDLLARPLSKVATDDSI